MKTRIFLIITIITTAFTGYAQSQLANKYLDTAVSYQRTVKNYTKALKYYELAIKAGNNGNYTFYNAAQCACQVGQTDKAIDYYKKGFAVLLDYYNYEYFANDTLIKCFSDTPDWKKYLALMRPKYDSVTATRTNYLISIKDTAKRLNHSMLTDSLSIISKLKNKSVSETIKWIRNYKDFASPPEKNHGTVYTIKINDSLTVPFFVYIPIGYDPVKKNKLYVFLHGGVSQRPNFISSPMLYDDDKKVLKKPIDKNAIIIYPLAKKGFNWLYNQIALETIIKEIKFVKSIYNIDDNKVYIGGHSDGGVGTFWFATHKPSYFASFLGLNYNPFSYFDNTDLGNLRNEVKFYGISGSEDGTFNINSVTNIKDYGLTLGDNWHGFTIKGGHGLPFDNPEATNFVYDSLFNEVRNPFPEKIKWETDNVKNGRSYWLEISQLDTLRPKSNWQQPYNSPSININGKTVNYNFNPHKSGAVTAFIKDNILTIQQSRVKELIFYVSPELVNLNKPVKIYVDNKLVFNALIKEDKKTILDEFVNTKDRSIIVVNKIKIPL